MFEHYLNLINSTKNKEWSLVKKIEYFQGLLTRIITCCKLTEIEKLGLWSACKDIILQLEGVKK